MSFQWSFSTDKLFRRCQRQFFFREIAAHHSPKEAWRREAFILKQLKSLEMWRGTVIHEGIQHYVVPALEKGDPLDWKQLEEQTLQRARAQLAFSEQKRYREPGIAKRKHEDFSALLPHERGDGVSKLEFDEVCNDIRAAFQRLATLTDLWQVVLGRKDCEAEKQIWVEFDDVKIMVQIDLLFERLLGQPTIIDWKSYELGGDTDARLQTALYGWALWRSKLFPDLDQPENIELLECQVQDGVVIKHECSLNVFDELEDYIYRSLHRIFTLCQSKKLTEVNIQDFAFTDNPNNCEYCAFRQLALRRRHTRFRSRSQRHRKSPSQPEDRPKHLPFNLRSFRKQLMSQHVFNLFRITNQNDLSVSYRFIDVDGNLGFGSDDPDLAPKNLNLLAKRLAFGQKLPVAIIRGGERPLLAVAADRPIVRSEYQLTPHVATLRPREEVHSANFSELDNSTVEIALSFLAWELRGHLYQRHDLWQNGPNTFFRKRPVNDDPRRRMNVYGGFSPRFLFVDGCLHVAVPVVYCYTDSEWADQAFDSKAIQRLAGRKMLYHFGPQIFTIKFQRRTGKTIREQLFCPEDSKVMANVFDWTVQNAGAESGGRRLDSASAAIRYKNVGNEKERYGALSLCKLILNNDDARVASSRRDHQRTPNQRIESATGIVKTFLAGLNLSGVGLKISPVPRSCAGKRFDCPKFRFGNGKILNVSQTPHNGDVLLKDLPRARVTLLEDKNVGFAVLSELDDQVLIAPRSLGVSVANDLKSRIERMVSSLTRKPYTVQLVRYNDENKRTLRDQVKAVVSSLNENSIEGGRGVLVLPPGSQRDLHNYIKKKLRNRVQFQCMSAEKLGAFYKTNWNGHNRQNQFVRASPEGKFHSYLLNAVMGLMIVNRQWPWVLHKPTHCDAYVGLDVLDHTAAFTFFYEGGAVCAMRDQESSHKEKLSRGSLPS